MTGKTCATCKNWSPKESGGMAKHRMALCSRGPKWKFYPPQASCPKHDPAAADVVQSRMDWLEK
jgi:hypothetical protein